LAIAASHCSEPISGASGSIISESQVHRDIRAAAAEKLASGCKQPEKLAIGRVKKLRQVARFPESDASWRPRKTITNLTIISILRLRPVLAGLAAGKKLNDARSPRENRP
jgi:hypothetical protein